MTKVVTALGCVVVAIAACKESAPPPAADTSSPIASTPKPPLSTTLSTTAPTTSSGSRETAAPVGSASASSPSPLQSSWSFDSDKADAPPAGFSFGRTGGGKEGRWVVAAAGDAPSKPNVLVQLDADPTDHRFPVAVVDATSFKDVRVSASCKPISGKVDQGCGLVWRYKDANNYYVTRANALEDNVRLYYVKGGNRVQLASWSGKVASNTWHKLRAEARGDRFEVYFDDKKVMDAKDATFSEPGKIGVWTKADSVIQFDDLSASAL